MTELGTITRTVLPAAAPYDFACSLRALAGFRPVLRDIALTHDSVRRALPHPTDPESAVVVEVTGRDDGEPGAALTVFSAAPLSPPELADVDARVSAWLGLRDDLAGFLRTAGADDPVRPLLALTAGLHQVRFSSLAEGVVYFTLLQNSTQWYATLRKRRLTLYLGNTVSVAGEDFTAFPDLPRLSHLGPAHLLPFVGARHRAERLAQVLAGVAALDETHLRTGPYAEAKAALLSIRGIGEFTAHALLLRALGRPDEVPLEMGQHVNTAAAVYGDPPPPPAELRDRYGRWIGWWAYTCRTALTWLDHEKREQSRRERARTDRQHPHPASVTRPRNLTIAARRPRHPAPWSPTTPGPAADLEATADLAAAADAEATADVEVTTDLEATPPQAGSVGADSAYDAAGSDGPAPAPNVEPTATALASEPAAVSGPAESSEIRVDDIVGSVEIAAREVVGA
ncbi:hypothetical protein [Dactylosporangium sp. CA-233914]|uniref:hypothetical protein n=1 Tax=Dactylosporangium sp. CA-233914 TaxID=3239934 RepID=UPI003D8D397D